MAPNLTRSGRYTIVRQILFHEKQLVPKSPSWTPFLCSPCFAGRPCVEARRAPRFENKQPLLRDECDALEDSCPIDMDFSRSSKSAPRVGSLLGGGRNAEEGLSNFQNGRSSRDAGVDRDEWQRESSNRVKYHDLAERNERKLTK